MKEVATTKLPRKVEREYQAIKYKGALTEDHTGSKLELDMGQVYLAREHLIKHFFNMTQHEIDNMDAKDVPEYEGRSETLRSEALGFTQREDADSDSQTSEEKSVEGEKSQKKNT